jgi:DNA invertase Pin-like site-specific DNA recombinase
MPSHSTFPVGYSYVRFSSDEQAKGDSLRRQTEAATVWCEKNGVRLDTSLTLHDLGKSAYTGSHRQNPDRNALAAFLQLIEQGKVPRGSYLLIENLDRLSREEEVPACHLLTGILMAGVRVVQMIPSELVLTDKSNGFDIMRAVLELSRGHNESRVKSERIRAAWSQKRRQLRESGKLLREKCIPGWLEVRNGKFHLIAERALTVQRIFQLAAAGHGVSLIVKKFTQEKVAAFGPSGRWSPTYIHRILRDRRAIGEFQPCGPKGAPDGSPLPHYFPAAVSEHEWWAAQEGLAQRRQKGRGKIGWEVNLFAGLVQHARDGQAYRSATRFANGQPYRVLINATGVDGRGKRYSIRLDVFEKAIRRLLREIDPQEVLGQDHAPDKARVLANELARIQARKAELEAELLDDGEVASVVKVLRQLAAKEEEKAKQLAQAQAQASRPLSAAWGELPTLDDILDKDPHPPERRLRLRFLFRRIIEDIRLLIVPRGRTRICACQVWFSGGEKQRSFLIRHRPPRGNGKAHHPGDWTAWSLPKIATRRAFDLRQRKDVKELEAVLSAPDLEEVLAEAEALHRG